MRTNLITSIAVFLLWVVPPSCTKSLSEQERRPELYASLYDFEYRVSANNIRYLVPVAHNRISEETVRKTVSGQGWKTTAVYKINQDKEVIKEYVLVTGGTISTARNETSPDYPVFSDDGRSSCHRRRWSASVCTTRILFSWKSFSVFPMQNASPG